MKNELDYVKNYARQAITTKYISPTTYKGSRVSAKCFAGEKTVHWLPELNAEDNHKRAAILLIKKLNWYDINNGLLMGSHDKSGYYFILLP